MEERLDRYGGRRRAGSMEKESGAGSIGSDARERERAGEIISEELKKLEGGDGRAIKYF